MEYVIGAACCLGVTGAAILATFMIIRGWATKFLR